MSNKEKSQGSPKKNRFAKYSAYLYLAMALLIVGVATASILMLRRTTAAIPTVSIPEISLQAPSESPRPHEEIPVFVDESDVQDTSSDVPTIAEEPVYVLPIENGTVQKACAIESLVFSETMKDYRVHNGIDIASPIGTPVRCYTDGIVESVSHDDFLGVTVTVKHSYGLITVYRNLGAALPNGIAVGRSLKSGDVIGYVGDTATVEASDPPHLHFEMKSNGTYIDPEKELYE